MRDSNLLINPYEGRKVDKLQWPFYRYTALMPMELHEDAFVWLYLSLCVYCNESHNYPKDNYSEEIVNEVHKIISDRFSSIIDAQTFTKIQHNAEGDYVRKDDSKTCLKPDTFSFLDTYENLFSDKLEQKFIYQDAITGEVVPDFDDSLIVEDSESKDKKLPVSERVQKPSKYDIKKAFDLYMRLKKYNTNTEEVMQKVESEGYFDDPDKVKYFAEDDVDFDETPADKKKAEPKSLRDYSVILLDNSKVYFSLDVSLKVEDNKLVTFSPFGSLTDQWLNRCLEKGKNISADLDRFMKEDEQRFLIPEENANLFTLFNKEDFASTLKHTETLYRLFLPLEDTTLLTYAVKINTGIESNTPEFYYPYFGKTLERLLAKIEGTGKKYTPTSAEERASTTTEFFAVQIDAKFQLTNIRYSFLKSSNIYDEWKKKYRNPNHIYKSFKADLVDIALQTNLVSLPNMYPDFFDDILHLYDLRNSVTHDNDENTTIDESDYSTLLKVSKVLVQLM